MVMPLVTWVYYLDRSMQGNPRESTTVLDSEFNAMDSWFQVLDSSFCQWNLDSGFQLLVWCWTPCSVFRNPKPRVPDSTRQKFHGFRNPDSPFHWAVHRGDFKVLIRSCHHLPAEESYDEARRLLRRKYGDDFPIGTTTSFICMTIQAHTVLQKLFLGIKITTQGNYVTLIIICHEHQNKLKYILWIVYW